MMPPLLAQPFCMESNQGCMNYDISTTDDESSASIQDAAIEVEQSLSKSKLSQGNSAAIIDETNEMLLQGSNNSAATQENDKDEFFRLCLNWCHIDGQMIMIKASKLKKHTKKVLHC